MPSTMRKAMVFLGLSEDDERYDEEYERNDQNVSAVDRSSHEPEEREAQVTHIKRNQGQVAAVAPSRSHEHEVQRITTIHPRSYNDAKSIGESFRHGIPVIMNLTDMDDSDAKRMVDFSAGLVYGLRGSIERVTSKVFLLSPEHVEVASDDAVASGTESGFYNQS